jgi:MFS family permease
VSLRRRVTGLVGIGWSTAAELARDGRGLILGAVGFGWFLGVGVRLAVPVQVPYIRAEFEIGLATAGLFLSVLWVGYALFQFPGGILGDRVGERFTLVASTALVVGGLAVCATAPTVPVLFVGLGLLGVATGLYSPTRFTVLTDTFPERAGAALGLSNAFGNVGSVLLPLGAGMLAVAASWRAGFLTAIPLFVLAALGLWWTIPRRTSGADSAVDDLSLATVRTVFGGLTGRRTVVVTVAMFLMSVVYQGFTSFYPTYLAATKGLSEPTATLLYSAFFAAGIAVQPVAGATADADGERRTMVAFASIAPASQAALPVASGFWPLLALSGLASAQLGFWPIAQAATVDSLPTEMQGTGFGLVRTTYLLLAAAGPATVGALADGGSFDGAFLLLAGCAGSTVVVGLLLAAD